MVLFLLFEVYIINYPKYFAKAVAESLPEGNSNPCNKSHNENISP